MVRVPSLTFTYLLHSARRPQVLEHSPEPETVKSLRPFDSSQAVSASGLRGDLIEHHHTHMSCCVPPPRDHDL